MKTIELVTVYRTTNVTRANPQRTITQFWDMDGVTLIAEVDPHVISRVRAETTLRATLRNLDEAAGPRLNEIGARLTMPRFDVPPFPETDTLYRARMKTSLVSELTDAWTEDLLRNDR